MDPEEEPPHPYETTAASTLLLADQVKVEIVPGGSPNKPISGDTESGDSDDDQIGRHEPLAWPLWKVSVYGLYSLIVLFMLFVILLIMLNCRKCKLE